MPLDNLNREARTAISDYVAQPLVAFVPGARGEPADVSSGTLFRTPGGNIVVLTAKHCVDDVIQGPVRLCWYGRNDSVSGTAAAVVKHPDASVDVAMFALWPDAVRVVRALALTEDGLAGDDDVDPKSDALIVAGVPAELLVRDGNFRGLWAVNYGTNVADPARDATGRLRVLWTEMETPTGNVEMPRPHGISGGALWRFRGRDAKGVWSPATTGRFIGVPVSWMERDQVEFVEPVTKWREWVRQTMVDMDEVLDA
jgi:hypothetical protein